MFEPETEMAIRGAAFDHLSRLCVFHGDVLPWAILKNGFEFRGRTIRLLSPQGIFKPQELELPLSIRTAAPDARRGRPYDDGFTWKVLRDGGTKSAVVSA